MDAVLDRTDNSRPFSSEFLFPFVNLSPDPTVDEFSFSNIQGDPLSIFQKETLKLLSSEESTN